MECLQLDFNYIQEEEKDKQERKRLVEENMGLIGMVLKKPAIKKIYSKRYEYEEVFQMGVLHLIAASNRFDESKNIKFCTYATSLIYYGIMNDLYRDKWYFHREADKEREGYSKFVSVDRYSLNEQVKTERQGEKPIEKIECLMDSNNSMEEAEFNVFYEQATHNLSNVDKKIFELYFKHKKTQNEIAEILNVRQATISRRIIKSLNQIRNELGVSIKE
ncbi:MAG: sigma-70 family RNA polymerase sigma factor [Clostridium sp.]|uniref:sigma-70 family RNA polymerase sigma factor n=1 Tax=Clostridium sp. TaxID=1506 RepID=UPI003EE737B2